MGKLADAWVQLDTRGLPAVKAGLTQVQSTLNKIQAFTGLGVGIAGAEQVGRMLVQTYIRAAHAAEEAEMVNRRLAFSLKLAGGAAGTTADEIADMADELQMVSNFDDEGIKSAAAALVRLGLGGRELRQATRLAVDLAAAMGTDVASAGRQLGLALSDPANNLGILRRHFREFRKELMDEAVELARSGDVLKARAIIINELGRLSKGAAEQMQSSFAQSKNAVSDLMETIGKSTVVDELNKWVTLSARFVKNLIDAKENMPGGGKIPGIIPEIPGVPGVPGVQGPFDALRAVLGGFEPFREGFEMADQDKAARARALRGRKRARAVRGAARAAGMGVADFEEAEATRKADESFADFAKEHEEERRKAFFGLAGQIAPEGPGKIRSRLAAEQKFADLTEQAKALFPEGRGRTEALSALGKFRQGEMERITKEGQPPFSFVGVEEMAKRIQTSIGVEDVPKQTLTAIQDLYALFESGKARINADLSDDTKKAIAESGTATE